MLCRFLSSIAFLFLSVSLVTLSESYRLTLVFACHSSGKVVLGFISAVVILGVSCVLLVQISYCVH